MSTSFKVDSTKSVIKLIAGEGYLHPGRRLAKLRDTGNGFIIKVDSWTNCDQDNYICLDYSEAEYLRLLLEKANQVYNFNGENDTQDE
jgi:hypothetical protein